MDFRKNSKVFVGVGLGLVSLLYYLRNKSTLLNSTSNNKSSSSCSKSDVSDSNSRKSEGRQSFSVVEDMTSPGAITEEDKKLHSMGNWASLGLEQPLVIAMVGLPARGKSYIVKVIIRYLTWIGFQCEVFNVGSYRRKKGLAGAESDFFDPKNEAAFKLREAMAEEVQNELYKWLKESDPDHYSDSSSSNEHDEEKIGVYAGFFKKVAIFDATNTTKQRRAALIERSRQENTHLLFVESICDDQDVLHKNYELKLDNEDYKGKDRKMAIKDFEERVKAYQLVYETIEDDEENREISYIKVINVGQKVITHKCNGYLPSQVAFYLQNIHIAPRQIYLCLNAGVGSEMDYQNGQLSESGRQFSDFLGKFFDKMDDFLVLSGTTAAQAETILNLRMTKTCYTTPLLNDLRRGDYEGTTEADFKKNAPEEYMKMVNNKLNYRYPGIGGESYLDVIERIRPVIIELERQRRSVLLVCHLAVMRCVYGYFMGIPRKNIPNLTEELNQLHVIHELTPGATKYSYKILKPENFADLDYSGI
jgi:broad specificity phosphatase PhoE